MRRVSPIAAILLLVGAFRFSLLGRGAMAFLDETMYYKAALALAELGRGHVAGALTDIASNNGRPGNAIVQMIPAALQAIPFAFGVPPSNPRSLLIPVAFNVVVSLVTLYLFFRISLLLFASDRVAATVAALVYGLLANSNIYVRHLLAYEPALSVGMAALWLALSRPRTLGLAAAVGMLAGFAVTVYPGYYLFAAIPGVALAGLDRPMRVAARARVAAAFAVGGLAVVAATELLCRLGGVSYLETARALSQTVTQGSFDEGWIFVPRYLIQVERYAGVVLLCGTTVYVARVIWEIGRSEDVRPIHWLVVPAIGAWAWQAAASSWMHSMVLYGRLIHPWMAFMVWATIDAVRWARGATIRTALYAIALAASVATWSTFAPDYFRLSYPADVLYALRIDTGRIRPDQRRCQMRPIYFYDSPAPLNRASGYPYTNRNDYLLVNFCMGSPAPGAVASDGSPPGASLLFRAPHFMAFRAYGFEGLTPQERDAIGQSIYDLRVFEPAGVH